MIYRQRGRRQAGRARKREGETNAASHSTVEGDPILVEKVAVVAVPYQRPVIVNCQSSNTRRERLLGQVTYHYSFGCKRNKESFGYDTTWHVPQLLCLAILISLSSMYPAHCLFCVLSIEYGSPRVARAVAAPSISGHNVELRDVSRG